MDLTNLAARFQNVPAEKTVTYYGSRLLYAFIIFFIFNNVLLFSDIKGNRKFIKQFYKIEKKLNSSIYCTYRKST